MEVEDRGLRVEVQQMLDTWDIEVQRRRTGARALVTVFSDARALLESVIEDEFVDSRTHTSLVRVPRCEDWNTALLLIHLPSNSSHSVCG